MVARGGGIVAAEQRDFAVAQQQPPVLGPGLVAGEQAAGALQPPGGDGRIAPEREVVPHEPQRYAGGAERVVVLAVQPKGSLTGVEGEGGVVEPPRGQAELLQGLWRLPGREARLEMGARFFPGSPLEGLGAGGERVGGSGHGEGNLARS